MKRIYRIVAAAAAGALLVGLTVYTIVLDNQKNNLKNQLSGFYQRSFEEIVSDMDSLKTKLSKLGAASGSGQYSTLLMDVWRQTGDTESSIASLPVSYQGTSSLTQFMNRTGDFCKYLSDKISGGKTLSGDDVNQINMLADTCANISANINEIWQKGYDINSVYSGGYFISQDKKGESLDFSNQQFPRLIYDGPFSESTENKQPQGLGSAVVTQVEAMKAAADFLGIDQSTLVYSGDLNGNIACYGFTGNQNGTPLTIYVTKQGGKVLWYMSQRATGISAIPSDERYAKLSEIARQYLKTKGYGDTAASYAQFYGGLAVINLAPVADGAVLYPDLIKVWVDISASDAAGMDANNYLMSHKQRQLVSPTMTKEEAQAKVNSNLQITDTRLALIPMDTGEEKLCYEFTGSINGGNYIVYIDAITGIEDDILMIQDTNDGKLVS